MVNNAYQLLLLIRDAISNNHASLGEEPGSDGLAYEKWEEQDESLSSLEDSFDEMLTAYDEAADVRPSLKRMAVDRR